MVDSQGSWHMKESPLTSSVPSATETRGVYNPRLLRTFLGSDLLREAAIPATTTPFSRKEKLTC